MSAAVRVAVVGAGALEPLQALVRGLPARAGFAVVVVCDAEPDAARVLGRSSTFPIIEARGRIALEPNRMFVVPRDCEAAIHRNDLVVAPTTGPRAALDKLLRSLAEERGSHGTGVILSGDGSDGVLGIRRLKEAGGLTIAQAPADEYDEMPTSAISTGMIDVVFPLDALGAGLVALASEAPDPGAATEAGETPGADGLSDTLHDILRLLRVRTGHDFSAYKRATLYRRVARRLQVCQCESVAAYDRYLREHPGELAHLLRDFLISVTNFFRDREVFDAVVHDVIPKLFAGKTSSDQVRIWVAGCATGEEAYSLAMLLCEHAGQLRDPPHIQVFATDIDEEALARARTGRYPRTIAVDVSPERLQGFFTADGDHFRVTKKLREIVLFSPHNVLRDPPFSRLDLISCRNVLIYLNRDAQARVLDVFHFGLRQDGVLLLGSSESAENSTLFSGLDLKHRLFVRRPSASPLATDSVIPPARWEPTVTAPASVYPVDRTGIGELHYQLIERYAPPSVLVDDNLDVLHVSEHAGRLLKISGGAPSRQLLRLIHPALRVDLRTAIHAAKLHPSGSDVRVVRFDDAGTPRAVELRVRSVPQPGPAGGTLLVLFDELDPLRTTEAPSQAANSLLEPMVRELEDQLRGTRDQLRTTIEQYETSLEELKASNEELQAMNEELRSATEELETSKEELQSVNEELTTLNLELKLKVDEVSLANSDMQNLMSSTDIGVVFLDRALNIKRFTPRAQDLINVISSDVGRPLAHLTHQLEADDLPGLARSVLQSLRTVERDVRSRDGRRYLARMLPYRSLEDRIDGVVLTFVEVSDLRNAVDARDRSEAALQTSEERLGLALRNAPLIVVGLDNQLRTRWGYVLGERLETAGKLGEPISPGLIELLAPGHADQLAEVAQRVMQRGGARRVELDVVLHGVRRSYDFRVERNELGLSIVGFDVTPSKLAEASLLDADRRKDEFLATLSHELRNPLTPLQVALDVANLAADDPAQLAHTRKIMERQVQQLTRLVDDLLDVSRLSQGKIVLARVEIDPVRAVEDALEATRALIQERGHQITIDLPKDACRVVGDHARLTQIITNLLNNAAKYTPPGGLIQLSLAPDFARRVIVLRIRDNGLGIESDLLSQIFEIFAQCRDGEGRSQGGLGIGLNLVRRLVELHGGSVSASSAGLGHGSEFIVELPLASRQQQAATPDESDRA